mgnify:CR=1 FL=1
MGKAAIQAQINAKRVELIALNGKINELESCRNALIGFSTHIEYVLKSHEHIKATYYLAGTPYLNETNNEEDILKTVEQDLSTKRDDIVTKLNLKIMELESQKFALGSAISILEFTKSITKEA